MSDLIERIESLNKRSKELNAERERAIGRRETLESNLKVLQQEYFTKYGVQVTAENIGALISDAQAKLTAKADALGAVIQAVDSGDYKRAEELLGSESDSTADAVVTDGVNDGVDESTGNTMGHTDNSKEIAKSVESRGTSDIGTIPSGVGAGSIPKPPIGGMPMGQGEVNLISGSSVESAPASGGMAMPPVFTQNFTAGKEATVAQEDSFLGGLGTPNIANTDEPIVKDDKPAAPPSFGAVLSGSPFGV